MNWKFLLILPPLPVLEEEDQHSLKLYTNSQLNPQVSACHFFLSSASFSSAFLLEIFSCSVLELWILSNIFLLFLPFFCFLIFALLLFFGCKNMFIDSKTFFPLLVFFLNFFRSLSLSSYSYHFSDRSIYKMMKPSSADTTIQKTYDTSSSTHSSHAPNSSHGLITPIMVSSLILLFILIFVSILCSKHSFHRNNNRHSSPGQKNSFIQIFSFFSFVLFLYFFLPLSLSLYFFLSLSLSDF